MRIIGPKIIFIFLKRIVTQVPEGEIITFEDHGEFSGLFGSFRGHEGISHDVWNVILSESRLYTECSKISEDDMIKLKESDRFFDVAYVDNCLLQNKIWAVDLLETTAPPP